MATTHLNQMELCAAIFKEIDRQGIKHFANDRQANAVIEAANLIVDTFAADHRAAKAGEGLVSWLTSDDTGLSSRAMARHLGQIAGCEVAVPWERFGNGKDHPHDPADLGRCVRLLDSVPELRPHLARMADLGPAWAALAGAWDEIEGLYREESPSGIAPRCYDRMRELIGKAMKNTNTEGA